MRSAQTLSKIFAVVAVPLGVALLLGFGIAHTGLASTVRAQEQSPVPSSANILTLTAIPPRLGEQGDLLIKPGEKKQISIQVKNSSEQTVQIFSQAEDFIIDEDGKTPIPLGEKTSNRWSLSSWLTLVPGSQLVKPNQLATINVLIEVPLDALPGGHYAMITHQPDSGNLLLSGKTAADLAEENTASGVSQRVGTLLYVIIDGPVNEEAFIRNFKFPSFSELGPVAYSFDVENMSDLHIRPRFNLEIFDVFGRRVDAVQPESKNIFPLTSRSFSDEWRKIWGTGYYTAKLTMSFGSTGQVVIAKTTFWLFPLKLVLTGLVVMLALIASGISIRRHLMHRGQNQEKLIQSLQEKVQRLESNKFKDLED